MFRGDKPKSFWLGVVAFGYSFFLFCQGIWLLIYYPFIYPVMVSAPFPSDYYPPYTGIFRAAGAILPSLLSGIILILSLKLIHKKEKPRLFWLGLTALGYAFILLLQTIWALFIFPSFYSELSWYAATDIFMNFPRFFELLGVVVPPIIGLIIFGVVGLELMAIGRAKTKMES